MAEALGKMERIEAPSVELSGELRRILAELQGAVPGILGSVITAGDGFPIAWDLKGGAEPGTIAVVGSLVSRSSERSAEVLDFGAAKNTIITTDSGSIGVFTIDRTTSLAVLLQPHINNILVLVEVRKAVERIRKAVTPGF